MKYLDKEANRIFKELIISKSNKSMIELYEMLLGKKYIRHHNKILIKVIKVLSDNNYEIIDINNFKLKHFQ